MFVADDSEYEGDLAEELEDDNSEEGFMQLYSDTLNEELNATILKKSFIRAHQQSNNVTEVIFDSVS